MDFEIIIIRLNECLKESGYTAKTFAKRTGISEYRVKRMLSGEKLPTARQLEVMIPLLKVSADYVLGLSDEK